MNNLPKLEILARELESMRDKKLIGLIKKCRNDDYPKDALVRDLKEAKLKFFADKVSYGYYEKYAEIKEEKDA